MVKSSEQEAVQELVDLKDPALAAFLTWLIPGLGHLYQGRRAKAALFFICIMTTFVYGCYLGGSSEFGWGRVVYFSWRPDDRRLPFICQVGAGLPSMPALVQAYRMKHHRKVWFNGVMAPPIPASADPNDVNADQPTAHTLQRNLHRYFDLGTTYTMIAGLLNVLVIYDAWGGPVFSETAKKDDEESPEDEDKDETTGATKGNTRNEANNAAKSENPRANGA